jgi:Raf kinase inhibitor-like YbhB/YbcL family protein
MAKRTVKRTSDTLAIHAVESGEAAPVAVESPEFTNGDPIPDAFSDYGRGSSPALKWSRVPAETQSFAVIVEDPDAPQKRPFVHWLLYNVPGNVRELPASIPPDSHLDELGGALQGSASNRAIGYFGPRPPTQDDPHRYHFEVFCLDSYLEVGPGAERDELVDKMRGHVLAKGELIGTFEAPVP